MAIKSVLVPLNEGERCFDVLQSAFVVARRFGAHITAVHARQDTASVPFVFSNLTGALKEAVLQETAQASQRVAGKIGERFVAACESAGVEITETGTFSDEVTASFEVVEGRPVDVLIERARLSDVTAIASPQLGVNTVRQTPVGETLESIMLGSGRPVLIVPQKWDARHCENAAIGWNESVQSSRALAMTIPWLRMMGNVTLVVSRERSRRVALVQDYLRTHGIEAGVKILNRGEKSSGEALLDRCREMKADFLVVGGYSRARPRQLLFGGVTRHLMKNTDIVTVMVH
ncbi:hypothetical protein AB833_23770 [Chromatiales bacterium (ex Bugula neritina AB1)]|nr:hypothetical protein AB833_23770 [Chromatiales bacterium (ex Bugula neritina AB1)]